MTRSDFNKFHSEASTGSAVSVVNALATGKGSAIGIDIECRVSAELKESVRKNGIVIESEIEDPHNLIVTSSRLALKHLGTNIPNGFSLMLKIDSKIPQAVGLKSSSAVSIAVVDAVFKLTGRNFNSKQILDVSCKASKVSRASLTGAYDDAAACLLGGLVSTNNTKFEMLKHTRVPDQLGSAILILIPKGEKRLTSSVDRSSYSNFKKESMKAFEYALKGHIAQAMLLNSMIQCSVLAYSFLPISDALMEGASAAGISGKGPAVAAFCRSKKTISRVRHVWLEKKPNCEIIETRVLQPSEPKH
ncbi:MAG: shikimate kinase [Nitrososphaerales archaeon]